MTRQVIVFDHFQIRHFSQDNNELLVEVDGKLKIILNDTVALFNGEFAQPGSLDQYIDMINEVKGLELLITNLISQIREVDDIDMKVRLHHRVDLARLRISVVSGKLLDYSVSPRYFIDDRDEYFSWLHREDEEAYREHVEYLKTLR